VRTCAGNNRGACRIGKVGAPGLLAPALGRAFLAPPPSPRSCGAFLSVKRLTACGFVNFVNLTSQKRTLGGDAYRDPRATEAPLLLSEGASHGGGPSQKLAAALVRPAAIP
jgi:hypothetical protein